MNLPSSGYNTITIYQEEELNKKLEDLNYLIFSSAATTELIRQADAKIFSNFFKGESHSNTNLLIDLFENLSRKSFNLVTTQSNYCFLKTDLENSSSSEKIFLPYLNLQNIPIYTITDYNNKLIKYLSAESDKINSTKKSQVTVLGFFDKKMALNFSKTCKYIDSDLKVNSVALDNFFSNNYNDFLNLVLIPNKEGYGEKIYSTEQDIFSIGDKKISLASFSKNDLIKSLKIYSRFYGKKLVRIREFETNFFIKKNSTNSTQNYFFVSSESSVSLNQKPIFQKNQNFISSFYFRFRKIYKSTPFFKLEKIKSDKNDLSYSQTWKTLAIPDYLKNWDNDYKRRILRRNKKMKKTSFFKSYLKLLKKQRRLKLDKYDSIPPSELRKQNFSRLSQGKSRIKTLNDDLTFTNWNNLSSLSRKFSRKNLRASAIVNLEKESPKIFLKYFQVNRLNYLKKDFKVHYLTNSPSSRWWKYHNFLIYVTNEKPKIKKNRIDWNTGKLTHSNNYEPLEKKWIIDSSSRKVDSVFLTK